MAFDPTVRFVVDLTIAVVGAALGGSAARLLRVSPLLGYLLAGVIIGPFTPGYVANQETLSNLAELGVIFLLFSIGLGFSPSDLRSYARTALSSNMVLLPLFGASVVIVCVLFRFDHPVTFGLLTVVSSTAIGVSLLGLARIEETPVGRLAFGILIAQDLIAVVLLIVCSTPTESLSVHGIVIAVLRAAVFVIVALTLGATLLPRLYAWMVDRSPTDALVIGSAAVALIAACTAYLAGLSFAFGAFIAGAVISEAAGSHTAQRLIAPFRDLFASLFFVSVGMLVNPKLLASAWQTILLIALLAVVTRYVGWRQLFRVVGSRPAAAGMLGLAMVPLGEFNLVMAETAAANGRINATELSQFLGVVVTSIVAATILMRVTGQTARVDVLPE